MSKARPLVLAIEDLHWIDRTTEEFLDHMIGWLPEAGILLILLYRNEYTHHWGAKPCFSEITLGQFSMSRSAELVSAILEGGYVAPELRDLILGRSAGNPFFMEELTFSMIENGSIRRTGESFVLTGDISGMEVPDTIQGVIAGRIDRLEGSLKRMVQVAAVIGREFTFRILETISEMKEGLKSGLVSLQRLEFILRKSLLPELEYIFRHALTQEVAYNSLLLQRRKEIHERTGKAIEELYPHRLEEFYEMLAWHYSHSDNRNKAFRYLKLSGLKAARSHSHREAFRLFKDSLEVLHQMPKTPDSQRDRLEILSMMAGSMRPLGYPESSIGFLLEGEALAKDLGDEKVLANFFGYMGHFYSVARGDPALAKTYIEKALSTSELTGEVEIIAPAVYDFVTFCTYRGEVSKICEVAPKCIELIERTGTQLELFGRPYNIYPVLRAAYGSSMGVMGNFGAGERILEDCREFARQISSPYTLALIETYHGAFYSYKGDNEKIVEHWKAAAELCEKSQILYLVGYSWAQAGHGYLLLEQPEKALQHFERGLKIHLDVGKPMWLSAIHAGLARAHLQLGNLEKALVHAEQGINLSRAQKEGYFEAEAEMYLGMALGTVSPSRFDEAKEHILRGINIADELKLKPQTAVGHFYLGELSCSSGRTEEAMQHLRKAESMFRQMGMDYWLGKAQKALARLL
jgi:tetratricopeptide (TPR) repeat protein